ncbi:MAG: thioredoxin domain-containing protein [Patescibacteria group bacterium]|nr:thioredoxin domain-containing protein [Patescibacteria group bacterium]
MEEIKTNSDNNLEVKPKRDYVLPASILIAALLVSISLVYSAGKKADDSESANLVQKIDRGINNEDRNLMPAPADIKPVTSADHILGNLNASVKIVTFSDFECPFCKTFHLTMKQILPLYGDKIAWVFRQLPLDILHQKAKKVALATECVSALGGNDKFWKYVDKIFEITPSNDGLDLNELPKIAEQVGVDRAKFQSCLDSNKYIDKIEASQKEAENVGIRGTPFSLVIAKDGKKYAINGALPFSDIKLIIDEALK